MKIKTNRVWLTIVSAFGCALWLSALDGVYRNNELTPTFRIEAEGKVLTVYDGMTFVIATTDAGTIVREPSLNNRAAFAMMIRKQWCSEAEMASMASYIDQIGKFIRLEGMAQIALFFRDSAARMLVDVGVAYLRGDPSEFTREVARDVLKQAGKDALKSTIMEMGKNPDNFLRAVAIQTLKRARSELEDVLNRAGEITRAEVTQYEDMEKLDADARTAYVKIVPAMGLIQSLRPGGDAASQLRDLAATMADRLGEQIPGRFEALGAVEKGAVFGSIGAHIDEVYKRYLPYRTFQQELEAYLRKSNKGNSSRRQNAVAKVDAGQAETRGFSVFQASRIVMMQSFNLPDYYIGHPGMAGTIIRRASPKARQESTYRLVPGLADRDHVSFESVQFPGYYLRHRNNRIRLEKNDRSRLFEKDATFRMKRGLFRSSWSSFESVSYPGFFIRHSFYKLWIHKESGDLFRKDATFKIIDSTVH